jgi:hypothetical protein
VWWLVAASVRALIKLALHNDVGVVVARRESVQMIFAKICAIGTAVEFTAHENIGYLVDLPASTLTAFVCFHYSADITGQLWTQQALFSPAHEKSAFYSVKKGKKT